MLNSRSLVKCSDMYILCTPRARSQLFGSIAEVDKVYCSSGIFLIKIINPFDTVKFTCRTETLLVV